MYVSRTSLNRDASNFDDYLMLAITISSFAALVIL